MDNDSFKNDLDAIKAGKKADLKESIVQKDFLAIIYGLAFIFYGVMILSLNPQAGLLFPVLLFIGGGFGVIAGISTFVWKSPKVKLLQAADSGYLAFVFIIFTVSGTFKNDKLFGNPLVGIGLVAFMCWSVYSDLKEYKRLVEISSDDESKNGTE